MRFAFAFASKGKGFAQLLNLLETVPSCCGWKRGFSGASYDHKELDDAVALFSDMVKSRPFPSIIEFSKLLSAIAKLNKYGVVISLGEKMQMLGITHNLYTYSILI